MVGLEASVRLQKVRDRIAELSDRMEFERASVDLGTVRLALRDVLDQLDELLRREGALVGQPSAAAAFARVKALDSAFKAVDDAWIDIRLQAGAAAGREILQGADVYGGYARYWRDLTEHAWQRRATIEEHAKSETAAKAPLLFSDDDTPTPGRFPNPRLRAAATDPTLIVDLKYATDLSLAEIGELAGISPAAAQFRTAEFEQSVFATTALSAIERQIPEGWRLDVPLEGRRGEPTSFVLSRTLHTSAPSIVLDVLPVWPEREGSAGRPRAVPRPAFSLRFRSALRIFAVVIPDGPRVLFLPRRAGTDAIAEVSTPADLAREASEHGYEILVDAMRAVGEAHLDGGAM